MERTLSGETECIRLLAILGISIFYLSCSTNQPKSDESENAASPPNIIYILADDLGYGDLSCYGQTKFSTPHIDRLASEGMKFTQHYSGSTVCAPSRSALMTGLHTGHTFIRGNKEVRPEGQFPLADSIQTIAEILQEQGYTTGAFGKWGLGPPGSEGDPNQQGFDEFFGYNCQRYAHHYYPRHLWHNQERIELPKNAGKNKGHYAPDLIQQQRLQFIKENADRPFFLFVPAIIPHAELVAPDEIMQKYRGKFLPETPYQGTDEGEQYREGPYESQKEPHAAFVAMIDILDGYVGEILQALDEHDLSDKTIVFFTSDNGPHLEGGADPDFFDSNGPLKGYKRDLYEGGIRVPLLVRYPGKIIPGTTTSHISAFWDMLPTLAEIAGASYSHPTDGLSMMPTLLGSSSQPQHEYLYWEFHEKGGRVAIRKDGWKAVKYDVLSAPNRPFELYDLTNDIGETNNLAAAHPDIIDEMESILKEAHVPSSIFTFNAKGYLQKE